MIEKKKAFAVTSHNQLSTEEKEIGIVMELEKGRLLTVKIFQSI